MSNATEQTTMYPVENQTTMETLLNALAELRQGVANQLQAASLDYSNQLRASTNTLNATLTEMNNKLEMMNDQVTHVQERVSRNEDDIETLKERVANQDKELSHLKDKMEGLENFSRRLNVRIIKVPERAEGQDIIDFVQKLLIHLFGPENFPVAPQIEDAHRSPIHRGDREGLHPRPIVVKFLRLPDKTKVLRLARQRGLLQVNGTRIHFYPDYSAEVSRRRRAFDTVKKKLREINVEFALMYPSVLRVNAGEDKPRLFKTPGEVETFIRDMQSTH